MNINKFGTSNTIFKFQISKTPSLLQLKNHQFKISADFSHKQGLNISQKQKMYISSKRKYLGINHSLNKVKNNQFQNFFTHRDSSELIDKILLKGELLKIKNGQVSASCNTSIQQPFAPKISKIINNKYMPQSNVKNHLDKKNNKIYKKNQNLTQNKYNLKDQSLYRSEGATPEWQKSMKLLRLQKQENQKSKKYCRIVIRRINTDLLFTKHKQNQIRDKIDFMSCKKSNFLSIGKLSRNPIDSVPILCQKQNIDDRFELNPWSTTELRLRESNDLVA